MTDRLLDFGTIDAFAASSAVTYCPVTLDLGADDYLANGVNAKAVFVAEKATTGFVPMLFSGSGNAPTDVYARGPQKASMAAGDKVELPIPLKLARYLRAGGTATATTGSVTCRIEVGAACIN